MADLLKTQYEALPYPHRDPADESNRVIMTELERFSGISHFVYGGKLDRSRGFHALVAGGGTGDALIALAFQLRALGMPGEIVYIDLSEASREIARARVAAHGFDNVRFETGSFLDPGVFAPASFDYINCSGVLHHLEKAADGLRALARLLRPEGGIGLMLYGALGRTGIYPAQEMLRTLAPQSLTVAERIRLARKLLSGLPESNWLRRNPAMNHPNSGDAELFDSLLHSRDRAYSVEEISELVCEAKLRFLTFIPPAVYRPSYYLKDAELLERLAGLDHLAQAAFAEKLNGGLSKHELYLVHAANPVAPPDPGDPAVIPMLDGFPGIPDAGDPVKVTLKEPYFQLDVALPAMAAQLLRFIDGERSLAEIHRMTSLARPEFERLWSELYAFMHGHGYIHLSRNPMPNLRFQSALK
jgi:ubiquinone/menaquinone biosynthesis C-methylase UbiE